MALPVLNTAADIDYLCALLDNFNEEFTKDDIGSLFESKSPATAPLSEFDLDFDDFLGLQKLKDKSKWRSFESKEERFEKLRRDNYTLLRNQESDKKRKRDMEAILPEASETKRYRLRNSLVPTTAVSGNTDAWKKVVTDAIDGLLGLMHAFELERIVKEEAFEAICALENHFESVRVR